MKRISFKKGSALLMVLGMIAFMIVSALGFAAYMRYSRLPSSYIRRSVASRQLVKAGLARAIDDIDRAINQNPHPGVGRIIADSPTVENDPGNFWRDRVFMGFETNMNVDASQEGGGGNWSMTVPVLTLEGLAYIPPTLVNSARVYSRITASAQWHNLDYDAGRYAYVAIDVSDYFDVNRMVCGTSRSSASDRRVAFSYLFEDGKHTSVDDAGAQEFDQFLDMFRNPAGGSGSNSVGYDYSKQTPLVSVADLNLALWKKGGSAGVGGKIRSPFCDYMQGQNGYAGFYGITGEGTAFLDMYEMTLRHTFVTDGLYPSPTYRKRLDDPHGTRDGAAMSSPIAAGEIYTKRDLESADSQPIKPQHGPQSQKYTVETIAMDTDSTSTPMTDEFTMKLTTMGMLCLADYLDLDSDPLSLALPCLERRPMIAGIQPLISADYPLTLKSTMDPLETQDDRVISEIKPGDQTRMVERTVTVNFDEDQLTMLLQSGAVHLDVVYPFTVPEDNPVDYAVEGKLAFFFTDERGGAPTLRTSPNGSTDVIGSTSDPLHIKDENSMRGGFQPEKGVFSVAFGGRNDMNSWFKFNQAPKTEADAVKDTTKAPQMLATDFSTISTIVSGFKAKPLVKLTYQWMQTLDKKTGLWQPKYNSVLRDASKLTEVKFGLKPLSVAQGYTPDTANYTDDVALSRMAAGGDINVKLNLALWARLVECGQNGRVVDMVPACMLDDMVQNAEPFNSGMAAAVMYFNGPNYPIMRFDTGVTLRLGFKDLLKIIEGEISEQKIAVDPAAAICLDPRFNYAPEHWLGITPSVRDDGWLTKEDWLNAVQEFCQKTTGRDPDIFMATSDQGYLQSPYELAFLPRFTDLYKWEGLFTGSDSITGYYRNPSYSLRTSLTKKEKDGFSQIENVDLMWNSYDPFGRDRDAFADLGVTARGHGIKVNPYSDSTNILMAAFANTPSSWRFASTNNQQHALEDLTAQQFNSRFAMNGYESNEKEHVYMPWVTLNDIAGQFSSAVRSGNGDWESAFERMDWTSDPNSLCGVALDPKTPTLWGVDRKFLYGFWRDCFSADQQLFLIFVRAEPSMMGGEITGQVPPNLGARAVALVWRDPRECLETPVGDYPIPGYPHRTRILFYHSLD